MLGGFPLTVSEPGRGTPWSGGEALRKLLTSTSLALLGLSSVACLACASAPSGTATGCRTYQCRVDHWEQSMAAYEERTRAYEEQKAEYEKLVAEHEQFRAELEDLRKQLLECQARRAGDATLHASP